MIIVSMMLIAVILTTTLVYFISNNLFVNAHLNHLISVLKINNMLMTKNYKPVIYLIFIVIVLSNKISIQEEQEQIRLTTHLIDVTISTILIPHSCTHTLRKLHNAVINTHLTSPQTIIKMILI